LICASQSVFRPELQHRQWPQAKPSHGMATRSPTPISSPAPGPSASTIPTPSWPGISGTAGLIGQSPCAAWMSVWQRPQASIRTSTWPSLGSGLGTSSMVSGWVEVMNDGGLHRACL